MLTPEELRLFRRGKFRHAYRKLGAHLAQTGGVHFCTWAPHAQRVSVVGGFNEWDGTRDPMSQLGNSGVWYGHVAHAGPGAQYKYEIENRENGALVMRTDPYARAFESPGNTNSVVVADDAYPWSDAAWMSARTEQQWREQPMSIYEVHAPTWRQSKSGGPLGFKDLAPELAGYTAEMGFSHVELLPIFEHPLQESLGYQVTGFFAPTSRLGSPQELRQLIDHMHSRGIGVILDWVPLHFPKDDWALARFDGSPLYERDDPAMAEHPTWQTLIFNYGRPEVRNFLIANAFFWLQEFHVDGLRVDAVSSMLYLDDARAPGWRPNAIGGRENLPAIRFVRELNTELAMHLPGAFTIAEESTAFPRVTAAPSRGGLGFSMKWDMGWVNDTLRYMRTPFGERSGRHKDLTFGRLYAESERFVLSFSHDEVGAAKGSLYEQMYGDDAQKLSALRALACYQFTYPGKKLNFMGNEFGQRRGWDPSQTLGWEDVRIPGHDGLRALLRELNELYRTHPALRAGDFTAGSFEWLAADDAEHAMIAYLRHDATSPLIVVLNFSAQPLQRHALPVPSARAFELVLDSDAAQFGGAGRNGFDTGKAYNQTSESGSLLVSVAPLSALLITARTLLPSATAVAAR